MSRIRSKSTTMVLLVSLLSAGAFVATQAATVSAASEVIATPDPAGAPTSLGDVPIGVGHSSTTRVTLQNTTAGPATITTDFYSGGPQLTWSLVSNSCGFAAPTGANQDVVLPAGVTCAIDVAAVVDATTIDGTTLAPTLTFTPSIVNGAVQTFLPDLVVPFMATAHTGVVGVVDTTSSPLIPGSISGNVRTITFWNTQAVDDVVPTITLGGGLSTASAPTGSNPTCVVGGALPAGSACDATVQLAPSAVVEGLQHYGNVSYDAPWMPTFDVGWNVPARVVYPVTNPTNVLVADGQTATVDVTFAITSPGSTFGIDVSQTGFEPGSPGYSVSGGTCQTQGQILPGGSCTVSVDLLGSLSTSGVDPASALPTGVLDLVGNLDGSPFWTTASAVLHRVRPFNDQTAAAQVVSTNGLVAGVVGSNEGASSEPIDVAIDTFDGRSPGSFYRGEASVWYSWTPTASLAGPVSFSVSSSSPALAIDVIEKTWVDNLGVSSFAGSQAVRGNRVWAQVGGTYLIRVSSNSYGAAPFTLQMHTGAPYPAPGNDAFALRAEIPQVANTGCHGCGPEFDTYGATQDSPTTGTHSVWYQIDPVATAGHLRIGTVLTDPAFAGSVPLPSADTTNVHVHVFADNGAASPTVSDLVEQTAIDPATVPGAPTTGGTDKGLFTLVPNQRYYVEVDADPAQLQSAIGRLYLETDASYVAVVTGPAPTIDGTPAAQHAPATSAAGALVSWSPVTANGGTIAADCSPSSGSLFAIGTTTVNCTALYNGASSSTSFTVTVDPVAPEAPVITSVVPSPTTSGAVVVSFNEPWDGGTAVQQYLLQVFDGVHPTALATTLLPGSATSGAVTGLPLGTPGLTVVVTAVNVVGSNLATAAVPVLVPPGAAGQTTGTGTDPTTVSTLGNASTTVSASGSGSVTASQYPTGTAIPAGATPFSQSATNPFDVVVGAGSNLTQVVITSCPAHIGEQLWWFDPAPVGGGWKVVSPFTTSLVINGVGCLQFVATTTSAPSVAQLTGTVFATSAAPASATVVPAATQVTIGTSTTITTTVVDAGNHRVPNASVVLTPSSGSAAVSGTTDVNGVVTLTVSENVAAVVTYAATANGIAVGSTAITYVTPPPPPPTGADLGVSLTASTLQSGEGATYFVKVTNTGTTSVAPIVVSDVLPSGVAFRSASGSGWRCAASGSAITCTLLAGLSKGRTSTLQIAVRVTARTGVAVTNTVRVSGGFTDPTPADDSASITSVVRRN